MYYPSSKNKGADQLRGYAKLICAFVFAYAVCWFSHGAAHLYTCTQLSRVIRIATFCICENRAADQPYVRSNCEADQQPLCFRYTDSTVLFLFFLHLKFPASTCSHLLCLYSSVCVVPVRKPHFVTLAQ